MVAYIKSDLEFILTQIKIAEDHSLYQVTNGAQGKPLFGENGSIPTYNLSWGLRTVDGSYNHLLNPQWGSSDEEFPEHLGTDFRTLFVDADPGPGVMMVPMTYTPGVDNDGPTMTLPNGQVVGDRAGPGDVIDPTPRIISNLIVDQTLGNPAAILTALERAGVDDPNLTITNSISAAYQPLRASFDAIGNADRAYANASAAAAASPQNAALQLAAANALAAVQAANLALTTNPNYPVLTDLLEDNGIELEGINLVITNSAPDEGLSAPFNSWFTLFGQFFDHGLDLVAKGGSGTVMIPLMPDDPLYVPGSPTNFMVLTRATLAGPGPDNILGTADDTDRPVNNTTPFVDQNQTYTSHPSHQVFLREYVMNANGDPVATGELIQGVQGGMATWKDLKAQAADLLGIQLLDSDVGNIPLLLTDAYGEFIRGPNGFPQFMTLDGLVEANPADNNGDGTLVPANALRTGHAFLADIAHSAVPEGLADGDIEIGLGNPGVGGEPVYDNELLDAHYVAGDGRANENVGLTAVHHVFHAEHNRLVEHTKITVLQTKDMAFINEWLLTDLTQTQVDNLPTDPAQLQALLNTFTWDGERLFQAAKFGTEMQYQHLVFEEFARKIQPNINVFLVPDGYDVTIDASIVAEFAHVVYRFGHSMLTESIDRFDPQFNADHIGLIEGFLNPLQFENNGGTVGVSADEAAGAIVRGMTRQVGNEIDEFVTSALRNNLLGLPLDLATINLARGRDTGVPSLNEVRAQFYEATNQDALLKPYESWIDFASHLKHEASIINFIAAYGTHDLITSADTLEEKRDAALALIGLTTAGNESVAVQNGSFEQDSLATGAPNVITDILGNYTVTAPTGWTMTGTGGLYAPAASITNPAGLQGTNVAWLGQNALLSKDTGVTLEQGVKYNLTFDIGDRTDMAWPGGEARLVTSTGVVLATLALAAPPDGQWSTVSFETPEIAAEHAGLGLRIEIQQTGGSGNQILVDDVQLNVARPITLDEDDRQAFLNGTGQYAGNLGGLNDVDLWIGGLAEEIMPFGGMLGSTFNFVFEIQMEKLQSGDRFYYLQRLDGLHLFGEMENNSFAAMIMRNTDATHLPSDVFSTPGLILEVDQTRQYNDLDGDGDLEQNDPNGGGLLTPDVVRNNPATPGPDTNYLRYQGDEHVLLGGTDNADTLIAGIGDDTLYGDGGNDRLEGGFGNDIINAGDGDDIITDMGGDDNIKAGKGHDVVHAGPGLDLVMGNDGQDFIFLGTDMGSEVFAGIGNDFIYGNKNAERILGNEGDDWIETGTFDGAPGDNFDEIFSHDGIDGNDVFLGDGGFDEFIGEGGDDIMVGSPGRGKMVGMSGFDWATYKDNIGPVNADLSIPIVFDEAPILPQNAALDEYESVEGLSGSRFNDVLKGANTVAAERLPASQGGSEGYLGSFLDAQGIALINGLQAVLGEGVTFFNAGDIILGGDGSDRIQGNAGDDIIDGDKWLNVRIGIMTTFDATGPTSNVEIGGTQNIKSMTSQVTLHLDANGAVIPSGVGGTAVTKTLAAWMFEGKLNPGQLQIIREITTAGADNVADIDTAVFQGNRGEYAFSATADGQVIVTHAVEDSLDGTDRLRNIERVEFLDNNPLNIIVGTPYSDNGLAPQGAAPLNQPALNGTASDDLILGLAGADVLNGNGGNDILVGGADGTTSTTSSASYSDNFNNQSFGNSNGTSEWGPDWVETGDNNSPNNGQIQIDDDVNNAMAFLTGDGAQIQRTVNLAGATTASLSYSIIENGLDAGADNDNVTVYFSRDGVTFFEVDQITSTTNTATRNIDLASVGTGPFTANAVIRFVASSFEGGDSVSIDNLVINYQTVTVTTAGDTLNGGLGNDTYSFALGDGNDTINELANATSGGNADKISILAPSTGTDPETGLPILTINALNAFDSNTGNQNGNLVINYTLPTGSQQTITVNSHYNGTNAEQGVELINFNGAVYNGYQLVGDYAVSRLDNGRNHAAATANMFIAGEDADDDTITGGSGNDLIFGGGDGDDLVGGLGDDLLVGGAGNDQLDARDTGDPDNPDLVGAVGADTLVGGAGNDTYGVDDLLDVVVEAAGEGTDTVETFMAALSIENFANVENLTYLGGDADQFTGTGNSGNNEITGGDLNDTLSGLAGNDILDGGLGADILIGGAGNDTYIVDEAGDVVDESTGLAADVDTVESAISFTLAAGLENLTLADNDADINGIGNAASNTIIGNDGANQLFGGGGNDTLTGNDGNDLLDGGDGNDILNGGDDNDTIIGGAGNDTIDVGGGVNTIVYNSINFGDDIINSFDSAGGTPANQDRIDLSGLGVTAANFGSRVFETAAGGDTIITIRENGAASAIQGTIRINGSNTGAIDQSDFTLAAAAPPAFGTGTAAANTITGNGNANTINGLGGNDTLSGAGGDDVINGGEGADTLNGGDGNDTLSGGVGAASGTFADNFDGASSYTDNNGTLPFSGGWTEGGGETTDDNAGDIQINTGNGGRLHFEEGIDGGEYIQRAFDLTGATSASVQFSYVGDSSITGTENVTVQAWNHSTNQWETLTGGVLGTASGNFNVALSSAQIGPQSAIRFTANGDWDDGDNFFIENFVVNASGNFGIDTVNGDAGDDTIIWNANTSAPTDGRDRVNGGTEGAAGDVFVINGNGSAEIFRIYAMTGGQNAGLATTLGTTFAAGTEIVVTRTVAGVTSVIAELSEIEEIRLNGVDPSGPSGSAAGDTFEIIGDFSATSLRPNTITIEGDAGDDTVDISSLGSAHRIVFRSNGGNDTIIGTLRPQDVVELPGGATIADYEVSTDEETGLTTLTRANQTITFHAPEGLPSFGADEQEEEEEEEDEVETPPVVDEDDETPQEDDEEEVTDDEDDAEVVTPPPGTATNENRLGTQGSDSLVTSNGDDVLRGEGGDDFLSSGDGRDLVFGGAGNDDIVGGKGADMLYGDAGSDRIFGEDGDDLIDAGSGNDTVHGGAGSDTFIASEGDGNDTYYGDIMAPNGYAADTLDMSAITANVTVDLGTGYYGRGSASSSQTGSDTLWGVEDVITGWGNDRITASSEVNVMDGGAGADTYRFLSAADANGDTIAGFEAGDRIDVSAINSGAANNQFTLVTGSGFNAAGALRVTQITSQGEDFTLVEGNTNGGSDAEFTIKVKGHHNLTAGDFEL